MAAPTCETCKHCRPNKSFDSLWGLHKGLAMTDARCGMPQLPTMRYSLSERGNTLLLNRSGDLLYVATVRKMNVLCGPEGDFWEPKEKISRLTRAKNLLKRMTSRLRRKPKSA